jgi:hypothetical protein
VYIFVNTSAALGLNKIFTLLELRSHLTLELTGRQSTEQAFNFTDESRAIAAPVELSC